MKIGIIVDNSIIKKNAIKNLIDSSEDYNFDILIINIDEITINNNDKTFMIGNGNIFKAEILDFLVSKIDTYSTISKAFINFIKFHNNKIEIINENIEITSNRLLTYIILSNNGIDAIETFNLNNKNYKNFLDYPYIVKIEDGYGNEGIFKTNSSSETLNLLNTFNKNKRLIIQKIIKNYNKRDYRFVCTKNKIIKTFLDHKVVDNIENEELNIKLFKIMKILDLDLISVDMIYDNGKYYFIDINKSFLIEDLIEIF